MDGNTLSLMGVIVAAVAVLWRQNNHLGSQITDVDRRLARLEDLIEGWSMPRPPHAGETGSNS